MKLPVITSVDEAGGRTVKATQSADWTLVAYETAWITGLGNGVGRFDAATGKRLKSVVVEGAPCAALDAGFGAV